MEGMCAMRKHALNGTQRKTDEPSKVKSSPFFSPERETELIVEIILFI